MDIELNPGPYHLGSSSFQLNCHGEALLREILVTRDPRGIPENTCKETERHVENKIRHVEFMFV